MCNPCMLSLREGFDGAEGNGLLGRIVVRTWLENNLAVSPESTGKRRSGRTPCPS